MTRRVRGALLLSLCAGMVDAVGMLSLGHILLANMSGNTVHLVVAAADGAGAEALRFVWPLAAFVLGLLVTGTMHELRQRRGARWLALVLFGEAVLLAAVVLLARVPGVPQALLTVLGATAMGMQNASLRRAAGVSVFTTHVTGTLTKMTEALVRLAFWVHDTRRQAPPASRSAWRGRLARAPSLRAALLMGGLWSTFAVGALGGAALHHRWGVDALLLPAALLALSSLTAWWRPLEPRDAAPPTASRRPGA